MARKKVKPSPVPRQRASDRDLAGELIGFEHSLVPPERQAEFLARRTRVPAPLARAVAALHFAEARP